MNPTFRERREARKEAIAAQRQRSLENHRAEEAAVLEKYGKQIARGRIESSVVELYDKGFVRVLQLKGFDLVGDFERLVSIDGSDTNVQKKSAAGRTAGFVLTGGLNMMASNIRGDIILTIVTESSVHSISTQVGGRSELESMHRLQTVGRSILASLEKPTPEIKGANGDYSISSELEKLSELRESGALSDEEFTRAKNRLLG